MKMTETAKFTVLFLVFICFAPSKQNDVPRAETKAGTFLGVHRISETGKDIFSFTGIPYIEAPLGKLRFKPPVPAEPFKKDFNATKDDTMCPQSLFGNIMGAEDCVILNVHTPWNPSSGTPAKPLAVMVFIHGGGFVLGSSATPVTGMPDYLLEHDVVLVSISYRLGVLGFFSTEDEHAPGNYGLLDQVEALKWVKNNIEAFGGNPGLVTIFGESAGSASVHYLMLSPLAKGLFHRAIGQSGTTLSPWARTTISEQYTNALARKINCTTSSIPEMLDCLREKDAIELVKAVAGKEGKGPGEMEPFVWIPRIDYDAESPLLPNHPIDIMISGKYNKVPMLLGYTKEEGGHFLGFGKEKYEKEIEKLTDKWDNTCKESTGFRQFSIPEEQGTEMCKQIKEHYIDPDRSFEENKLQYVKMNGDIFIVTAVHKTIELMADHVPVYAYSFNYDNGHLSLMQMFGVVSHYVKGIVSHADDLLYVFKYPQTKWTTKSPAYQIVQMTTKIWTDFAKTGKPSLPTEGQWPQATSTKTKYVVIDTEPSIEEDYRPEDIDFMKEIFSRSLYNTSIDRHIHVSASYSIHKFLFLPIGLMILTIINFV